MKVAKLTCKYNTNQTKFRRCRSVGEAEPTLSVKKERMDLWRKNEKWKSM